MISLSVAVLVVFSSAALQASDQTAHFVTVAAEARTISAALGKPVRVEGGMGRLPILVMPRQGSPEQVLRLTASALNASVVDDGLSFHIRRSLADQENIVERRIIRVNNWLDARWAQWDRIAAKYASAGALDTQYQAAEVETTKIMVANRTRSVFDFVEPINVSCFEPAGRLLRKLIERIGARELATLPLYDWVFYSNLPNAYERKLPGVDHLVSVFAAEHEQIAAELPVNGVALSVPTELRLLVRVERMPDYLGFSLFAYGPSGRLVAQCFDMSRLSMLWGPPMVEGAPFFSRRDARWRNLDNASKLFVDTENFRTVGFSFDPSRGKSEPWIDVSHRRLRTNAMPAFFFKPDRFEPNDYVVREGLLGIADGYPERPFAAIVPDGLWHDAFGTVKDYRVNVAAFLHFLEKDGAEVIGTDEGTVIRLTDPDPEEERIANRKILGESVRGFAASNTIGVRQWCRTLADLGPLGSYSIAGWYLSTVLESVPSFKGKTINDPTFQRFLGTLTDGEWDQLFRSGTITLTSTESMQAFRQVISHEGAPIIGGDSHRSDALDRPVENLTAAEADNVTLSGKLDQSAALRVFVPGRESFGAPNSPMESPSAFGRYLTRLFHPAPGIDSATSLDQFLHTLRFKYFYQDRYYFSLPFSTGRSLVESYIQDEDAEAQEVGFDDLPQSIRDEVYAAYNDASKTPRSQPGRVGG
jgi:hypothetical protein